MFGREKSIIVPANAKNATKASELLAQGELVAIPTETVYGLAADACNGKAVARIFQTKGRPQFNPLICHVANITMAERFALFDDVSRALAKAFWPGPLTLILPLRLSSEIHPLVTAGQNTVAVRQPRGFAADIIKEFDGPLAAPSANMSGKISPTTADAVLASLGEKVAMIVDDGPCSVGLESTIVRATKGRLVLLRPGGVTAQQLRSLTHLSVVPPKQSDSIQAPGMLASHYAPNATMKLDATSVQYGEALLAFGPDRIAGAEKAVAVQNLSETSNLLEAASNLFSMMSILDRSGAARIAVEPIETSGIGAAINDRLLRAAAPRK